MQLENILLAEIEAKRFLERIEELKKDKYDMAQISHGNKHSGAIKRSSMDLTRALAKMRKSS